MYEQCMNLFGAMMTLYSSWKQLYHENCSGNITSFSWSYTFPRAAT